MPEMYLGRSDGEETYVSYPEGQSVDVMLKTLTDPQGIWVAHEGGPGPTWVESTDPDLAHAVAQFYGCPVGRPVSSEES